NVHRRSSSHLLSRRKYYEEEGCSVWQCVHTLASVDCPGIRGWVPGKHLLLLRCLTRGGEGKNREQRHGAVPCAGARAQRDVHVRGGLCGVGGCGRTVLHERRAGGSERYLGERAGHVSGRRVRDQAGYDYSLCVGLCVATPDHPQSLAPGGRGEGAVSPQPASCAASGGHVVRCGSSGACIPPPATSRTRWGGVAESDRHSCPITHYLPQGWLFVRTTSRSCAD